MIQLRKHQEHLRDTLFWTALHESLLFEDLESATAYLHECRRKNINPPGMYSIKGDRVDSSGAMNPTKGYGKMPDHLDYVFGQLPVTDSEEFKQVTQGKIYCILIL